MIKIKQNLYFTPLFYNFTPRVVAVTMRMNTIDSGNSEINMAAGYLQRHTYTLATIGRLGQTNRTFPNVIKRHSHRCLHFKLLDAHFEIYK